MATVSSTDYQLKPGETITAYNQRIAGLRGDSSAELARAQQSAQSYATSNKTNASALNSRLGAPTAPQTTTPAQNTPYTGSMPQYTPQTYTPIKYDSSESDQYFKQLLDSLKPTNEENQTISQQSALEAQLRNLNQGQGVMNANISDQPIALPFITGQQSAVEKRYALQRGDVENQQQTLQSKLANLQARRQSAIDVGKAGVDYGEYKSKTANDINQINFSNTQNLNQYNNQLAQQAYENSTNATKYADELAQQKIDNALKQQLASQKDEKNTPTQIVEVDGKKLLINSQTGAVISNLGSASNDEAKQIQDFNNEAAGYIEKLGNNTISWGTAFNALKAKYPQASNELIDQTLGKDKYYGVTGT